MQEISKKLKIIFVVHALVDILFAIPLFFIPVQFLGLFGWISVDPIMSRLVAAALFSIAMMSFLERSADVKSYIIMLRFKIMWSAFALAGLGLSFVHKILPLAGLPIILIFLVFNLIWVFWYYSLIAQSIENNSQV